MIAELAAAFREDADDPLRALRRAMALPDNHAIRAWVPTAEKDAEESAERYRKRTPRSPVEGIPVVVKDCIGVAGLPTSNGTRAAMPPAASDAAIVQRMRAAGMVVFAKTNMHEFGIQPTGINPHHGTPVNPWDRHRIPGGSSSGSAVAVASGVAPIAVGTDAGGSVRVPAAINGLVGLKPTYGAVPLDGISRLTIDLDHAGPIAWTVEDATLLFEVLAQRGVDRNAKPSSPALLSTLFENVIDGVGEPVRAAAKSAFGELPEVASPIAAWAAAVEFVIVGTDAAKTCGEATPAMGADTRIILRLGAGLTANDRARADRVRAAMRRQIDALLERHDVLIGPATGCLAPRIHRSALTHGELDTVKIARIASQAFVANLTGHPSVVVPCVREGLPIGMQIIGRANDEARILGAARVVEKLFGQRSPIEPAGEASVRREAHV